MEHHCTVCADKGYTKFTWNLGDWKLLRDYYNTVVSPEFELHNTGGKTCILTFKSSTDAVASINIQFPQGIQYRTMQTRMSAWVNNSIQEIGDVIFEDSNTRCTLQFKSKMTNEEVEKYLRDGALTWVFEFTIVTSVKDPALRTEIRDADFGTDDICKKIKAIWDNKDMYDVTFVVEGKKLYAHKVILVAYSEVFRAMFTTEMKELEDGTVAIVDTNATVFEAFLSYMYTGRVSEIENVVDELIIVADKYQVMNLKKACERYMSDHINDDTAITYLLKAHQLSCSELKKKCIEFVQKNIRVLGNSSVLVKLSEDPNIVSQLFA